LTQRFYVSLQRTTSSDGFRFALHECSGVDIADSADGRRTVVVFDGADRRATLAARVVERWGDDRFDPLRNAVPGHGLLLIDRRVGSVQVIMPRIGLGLVFCKATADGLTLASEPRRLLGSETPSDAVTPTGLFRSSLTVGKAREFTYGAEFGISDEGAMLGHLAIGASLIEPAAARLEPPRRLALLHCVLSHHGPEAAGRVRGAGSGFASAEALALARINALDASVKGALEHGLR